MKNWQSELNELWHYMLKTLMWRDKTLNNSRIIGTFALVLFSVIVNVYIGGGAFLVSYYTDTFHAVVIGGIATVIMLQTNPYGYDLTVMTPIYVLSSWVLTIYVISGLDFTVPLAFVMFSYFSMYMVSFDFFERVNLFEEIQHETIVTAKT